MTTAAYVNVNLPIEDRVNDLLERMEIDEKLPSWGPSSSPT